MKDNNWHPISETPPDEDLLVRDEFGNEAYATPTWYPFTFEEGANKRSKPIPCEPYWDGGWLVLYKGMDVNPLKGTIVEWKRLTQSN